jgi:hypothetical protein
MARATAPGAQAVAFAPPPHREAGIGRLRSWPEPVKGWVTLELVLAHLCSPLWRPHLNREVHAESPEASNVIPLERR